MKRRMWQRGLSLLAAAALLAASLSASALAQEDPDQGGARDVAVDQEHFPDPAFRAWLLQPENLDGAGADGQLTEEELQAVTAINVSNQGIASLQGIGYFDRLESLNCRGNQLTALDLSANGELKTLNAAANRLTELTLRLPRLQGLQLAENQLTRVDITGCPSLVSLNVEMNKLEQLDLSGNPELVQLYCRNNLLTGLDLSHNTKLVFIETFSNRITQIDVSMLSELRFLHIDHNRLTTLDMSHNPKLEDSGFVGRNNDLRTLVLPNVPGLQVDVEDFLEQDPIEGSERSEWFYDSQYTQPIREAFVPGNGQTVYARRVPNRYTVRFYANGGAGSMEAFDTEYGRQFPLPQADFTRTGYTFTGWNTWPDGSGDGYAAAQQVSSLGGETTDGDKVDLYAQWRPNTYTIRYQAQGGQGSMEPTEARYDAQTALDACAFFREDSVFAGWSTRPDGPVEYTDGQTVKNLTAQDGGVVELYAVWQSEPALVQLSQAFAGYDAANYIGEDWARLEAACEAGRQAIRSAAGDADKQTALARAEAEMARVPDRQARAGEIVAGWETEFAQILALSVEQPAPEESAAAARSARQAVDKARPEQRTAYSSLTTPEAKAEAAALAGPDLAQHTEALTAFAQAMDWLDGVKELCALQPEQTTSDKAGQLALALEDYQALARKDSIQPSLVQQLSALQALARVKQQAVAELENRWRLLAQQSDSQQVQQQLQALLEEGRAAIECGGAADGVAEALRQATERMEQVKPEPPQPTQTPAATATPKPTETPAATATPQPTETLRPAQTPQAMVSGTGGAESQSSPTASPPEREQAATATASPQPTGTPAPTESPAPTEVPVQSAAEPQASAAPESGQEVALVAKKTGLLPLLVGAGTAAAAVLLALGWGIIRKNG